MAQTLRQRGVAVPILLISGLPSPTMKTQAAALGAGFLAKPLDEAAFIGFVTRSCNGLP